MPCGRGGALCPKHTPAAVTRVVDCVHIRVNVELDAHRLIDGDVPQDVVRARASQSTTRVTPFTQGKAPDIRAARAACAKAGRPRDTRAVACDVAIRAIEPRVSLSCTPFTPRGS